MARAIAVAAGTGDVQAVTGSGTLVGYSVRETAAATATLTLRDGTSAAGAACILISLPASTSQTAISPAIDFSLGLFVDRVTGTSEIVLYVA